MALSIPYKAEGVARVVTVREELVQDWLSALASRTPAPGGGAAAALAAATSASLVGMVAVYTTGERWADRAERMGEIDAAAAALRERALALAEADAEAFEKVGAAYKLPKDSPAQEAARGEAIQAALLGAAKPPIEVGETALSAIELAEELVDSGNPNVISDVAVAASLARAALEAAVVNIEINRAMIDDEGVRAELADAIESSNSGLARADSVTARVRAGLQAA